MRLIVIDLKDNFEVDDIIFIRFRLFADPLTVGWGWAIDNVEVRLDKGTPVFDPAFEEISIFPNPASDFLRISLPQKTRATQVFLSDLQGRRILAQDATLSDDAFSIDLQDYASGVYLLEVMEGKDLVVSEKIVVTK